MDDILILAIGRQHVELSAALEKMIQLVKKLQEENAELKKRLDNKSKE